MLRPIYLTVLLTLLMLTSSGCREDPKTAIPRLKQELTSTDAHVRGKAAHRLAGYGKDATGAVNSLITALDDSNGGVRSAAAYALRKIGTKEAISALERAESKQWSK